MGKIHSISGPSGIAKATNPFTAAKTSNLRDGKPILIGNSCNLIYVQDAEVVSKVAMLITSKFSVGL